MNPNPTLDCIIARETCAEMLDILTPRELALVAMRLDTGWSIKHASEVLGISQQAAHQRMLCARKRVLAHFPDRTRGRVRE